MTMDEKEVPIFSLRMKPDGVLRVAEERASDVTAATRIFANVLRDLPHEEVWMLVLNGCNAAVGLTRVSMGGLHGCAILPRDVLRSALAVPTASAIIIAHNHPSGDPKPSADDVTMTRGLKAACDIVGITFLDHLVLAFPAGADKPRVNSLRDLGVLG